MPPGKHPGSATASLAAGIWIPALLSAGVAALVVLLAPRLGGVLPAAAIAAGWLLLVLAFALRAARSACGRIERLAHAVESAGGAGSGLDVDRDDPPELQRLQRAIDGALAAARGGPPGGPPPADSAGGAAGRDTTAGESDHRAGARFLAAASHDLRQPLSALLLLTSTLARGEHDPERLARIEHVRQCAESLNHLFGALLDLSRLEAGAMTPEPAVFALDGLFDELSRTFRPAAEQRQLRLVVRKTDARVRCDRIMLSRILGNLVSNAIRYTREGGVLVGARTRGRRIRIDVWDTGPGIAPEAREQVFEEFFRAHRLPVQDGETQSFGLGLATVRGLCRLLEVPIRLRSRLSRGTVFSIEVPLADAAECVPADPPQDLPLDVSGLRVLVIDDEPSILLAMRTLLEDWGCEVDTAGDADTALGLARTAPRAPDLVISDLCLGGRHGGVDIVRMLERIYADRRSTGIARLLITGETGHERLRELSTARIPVLFKPVSPERLREAIMATIALGAGAFTPPLPQTASRNR